MRLKFSAEAREDIRAAQAWWKSNRLKSPLLLSEELRSAFALVRAHPGIGKRALDVSAAGIQRYLLRGTAKYLYYLVQGDEIVVLRLWNARAPGPPEL